MKSKGRDFREPRRRGFDDDGPSGFDTRTARVHHHAHSEAQRAGMGGVPVSTGPELSATVKWFKSDKGFGFVELSDGSGDAFLHIGALQSAGHEAVSPGTTLRVQVGQGQKGPQVTRVLEVDTSTATAEAPRGPRPGGFGGGGGGFGGGSSSGGGFGGARPPRRGPDPSTAVEPGWHGQMVQRREGLRASSPAMMAARMCSCIFPYWNRQASELCRMASL